jgi:hypothetical protein
MNPRPRPRHGCATAAVHGAGFAQRRYFAVDAGADVRGPLLNVPPPLPGRDNVPAPLPGRNVPPALPGRSVPPPLPGRSVSAPSPDCAPATGLCTIGSPGDVDATSRSAVGLSWLTAKPEAISPETMTATWMGLDECMYFSCKGVLENGLAGAHRPPATRHAAVPAGDDLPAAKAVVGERSNRNTDVPAPRQGRRMKMFGSTDIAARNPPAAGSPSEDLHG